MAKSPWVKFWEEMRQPIDWAALAAQVKGPTRKGDKRALWEVEKLQAVKRENARRRQREAVERSEAERRARKRAKGFKRSGEAMAVILAAMEPDRWCTLPELKGTGLRYGTMKAAVWRLWRRGSLERRQREGWEPMAYPKGVQVHLQPAPARFEYRLTARGRAERAADLAQRKSAPEGALGVVEDRPALDQQVEGDIGQQGEREGATHQERD